MTTSLDVDGRTFDFKTGWEAVKYDEWQYYRRQFATTGAKAVDIAALDLSATLFLIEVKDYRHIEARQIPLEDLPMTVASKCRDTLGGLAAGRLNANADELDFSRKAMRAQRIVVVLHIELPRKGGRLSNPGRLIINLRTKLRTAVKGIDSHALVETYQQNSGQWSTFMTP